MLELLNLSKKIFVLSRPSMLLHISCLNGRSKLQVIRLNVWSSDTPKRPHKASPVTNKHVCILEYYFYQIGINISKR